MRYAIFLCEVTRALDEGAIARASGLSVYDVRLRTRSLPSMLASFEAATSATELQRELRAQGAGTVVVDTHEVAAPALTLRRFALEQDALTQDGARMPYASVAALVHVATQSSVIRVTQETRNIPRQGELKEDVVRHENQLAHALYVWPHEGAPWLLVEREAKYLALGPRMRPTLRENFTLTIELLRAAAPQAVFDERLALHPQVSPKVAVARGAETAHARHDERLDVVVFALMRWLTRGTGSLYRDAPR